MECSSYRIAQDVWTQNISPTSILAPTDLQTYLKGYRRSMYSEIVACFEWYTQPYQ